MKTLRWTDGYQIKQEREYWVLTFKGTRLLKRKSFIEVSALAKAHYAKKTQVVP